MQVGISESVDSISPVDFCTENFRGGRGGQTRSVLVEKCLVAFRQIINMTADNSIHIYTLAFSAVRACVTEFQEMPAIS